MSTLALMLLSVGCLPKGDYPLKPMSTGALQSGTLEYHGTSLIHVAPGMFSLDTVLSLRNTGDTQIRVDLTRTQVSVDGQPFGSCRHSATAVEDLVTQVPPGQSASVRLHCRDIAKPVQEISLRFAAAGTGASGEHTIAFLGFGERP
jgi:hypothetical protein